RWWPSVAYLSRATAARPVSKHQPDGRRDHGTCGGWSLARPCPHSMPSSCRIRGAEQGTVDPPTRRKALQIEGCAHPVRTAWAVRPIVRTFGVRSAWDPSYYSANGMGTG